MDPTPRKRIVREIAMQVLFLWDAQGKEDEALARQYAQDASDLDLTRRDAVEMAKGAWQNRPVSDAWVERLAPKWPPHRQPPVDRNILRLAIWELTHAHTPPKVILDEAIELAKAFSTEQSATFINGVLDKVLQEHTQLTGGLPSPAELPKEGE